MELLRKHMAPVDRIISLGFSIPPSDGHDVEALRSSIRAEAKVGLVYRSAPSDLTEKNWEEICPNDQLRVLFSNGIPLSSAAEIEQFWTAIFGFLQT
jgi:hypothetical protein